MYEKIKSLIIGGAVFSENTELQLFKNNERMCLLYGRNGSGKSTISRAFVRLTGAEQPEITQSDLVDSQGDSVLPSGDETYKGIFVYNEDYIQSRVRLQEQGLGTIVMFGEQVELESSIESARAEYQKALAAKEEASNKATQLADSTNMEAPGYYFEKIRKQIKGDANWAGREGKISGYKNNASVHDVTIRTILDCNPRRSKNEAEIEYQRQFELLCAARRGDAEISARVNTEINIPLNEERARLLLAQRVERPELSEREEYLLGLLHDGRSEQVYETRRIFMERKYKKCPYCLQEISDGYRDTVSKSIVTVLSKAVDDHKEALSTLIISDAVSVDLSPFGKLNHDLLDKCKKAQDELNASIERLNLELRKKIDDPYISISLDDLNIEEKKNALVAFLIELEKARQAYNEPFKNIAKLQTELRQLNQEIAYWETVELGDIYKKQLATKKAIDKELADKKAIEKEKKQMLDSLQAKRKNIKIAIDLVNRNLWYVFYSANRLEIIDAGDAYYALKSNGKNVKPSDISAGERNILALCYFFVEMLSNTDAQRQFTDESLVIIDDPISSFDHENRIGIMSLLRQKTEKIIMENAYSKVVVMTHDLQAAFDIRNTYDEISKVANGRGLGKNQYVICELRDRNIRPFNYNKRNEYSELLAEVYRFGESPTEEREAEIGNKIRRVLEAYSTFVYRKGITEISYSDDILAAIGNKQVEEYFSGLMYRLVLNGESHSAERTRGLMDDNNFLEILSISEKQRIAKDVICFIYLLNKAHVHAHLKNAGLGDYKSVIEGWCKSIYSLAN